jgi:hypothetical protein
MLLVPANLRAEAERSKHSERAARPESAEAPELATALEPSPEKSRQQLRRITEPGGYLSVFGTLMFGDGLRFNNPYRLSHQLGQTGESLSLIAPYADVAVVMASGSPSGLMHGGRLGLSVAMSGVPQGVITPAYVAALRPSGYWLLYAWMGAPFVTAPDFNVGAELAVAATYFVRAGIGVSAAIVADGFYGAGTRETRAALYPVLSAQLGVSVNYEVLP